MNINIELAKLKKLIINEDKEKYYYIQKIYKYYFEKYLLSTINLKYYDNILKQSNLGFKSIKKDNSFITCLNNYYIEKLSNNNIEILNNKSTENEIYNVIKETYKDIIKDNYHNNEYIENTYKICYGSIIPRNFADNDALVLKITYKDSDKLKGTDYISNQKEKKKELEEITKKIKNEVQLKLNIKCEIIIEKTEGYDNE